MVLLSQLKTREKKSRAIAMIIIENNRQHQSESVKKNFVSFCDLFKLQAEANPNAIAGIYEASSLTYAELDKRSSQLADFLGKYSTKSEKIIVLSLRNGLDLLVGFLGILKSGSAYLPIDPAYPVERIESILKDAEPVIVLTEESLRDTFSSFPYKIALMNNFPFMESIDREEPIQPNHLAYVIYTSGSTGKPKGIAVEHSAFSHAVLSYRNLHHSRLISLMSGSISFDPNLLVVSHTLITGGTVCIPKNEEVRDPERIVALIEKQKINYLLCVPSFYSMLLNKSRKLSSLEYVELAGENLPNDMPGIHAAIAPNAILYNLYGPSEYAIGTTFAKIYDPVSKQIDKITVGKSLPQTEVHILDEDLKHVATGVKGEIFIGGKGLARGYLNTEALTEERFIWVTFPGLEPIRLYKTGDFGRFLPDGNIEFLGRMDHQVKIRGYRIELGEIEYFISQYPDVNEVVVIAQGNTESHKRLAAYFSARTNEQISEKLRAYLQNILPLYMVPSALIQVERWSRTPNGKIDRSALSKLPEPFSKETIEQPMIEMEKTLFQIWKRILGREGFGIKDNFFDLGGDSLQIVTLQTVLEETLGIKINISVLFQCPTISQLANHLSAAKTDGIPSSKKQELVKKQKSAFQGFRKFFNRN